MGELIFIEDYKKNDKEEEEVQQFFNDYANEAHFEYLAGEIETLQESEVLWMVQQLVKRSGFEFNKTKAQEMIQELLEEPDEE